MTGKASKYKGPENYVRSIMFSVIIYVTNLSGQIIKITFFSYFPLLFIVCLNMTL